MQSDLPRIDAAAWAALAAAATDPASGFRYLALCSVDANGAPQARMVVLRRADPSTRLLEIHTDARSPKWREMSAEPRVSMLGFCAQLRLQLRLQGVVALDAPGSAGAERAWDRLPAWTRQTYAGGPPGDEAAFPPVDDSVPPSTPQVAEVRAQVADGKSHFGVATFRARTLDWFELRRQDNRRACFDYGADGLLTNERWVNP